MSFLGKLKSSKSGKVLERSQRSKDSFKTSASGSGPLFLDVTGARNFQDSEQDARLGTERITPPINITVQHPTPEPDRFTNLPSFQLERSVKDSRIPLSQSLDSIPTLGSLRKRADRESLQKESE